MTFLEAIQHIIINMLNFKGRARRKEFWYGVVFFTIISLMMDCLLNVFGLENAVLSNLWAIILIICTLAVSWRRLHDIGKTGWWNLVALIPLIGSVILLFFCIRDSQPGENKYGPNPKGIR